MSRYAWLACPNRRLKIWLGKVVTDGTGAVHHFHIGDAAAPPNSSNDQLNRVVWKFLAETAGEALYVVTDLHPEYERLDEYQEIGGDATGDTSFEDYLQDWSERPT